MSNYYRSVTAWIMNLSAYTLNYMAASPPFAWGRWGGGRFPEQIRSIAPGQTVQFEVESAGDMTGCEGTLYFMDTNLTMWEIYWNNPFIGHNTYTQQVIAEGSKPLPAPNEDEVDDDRARVLYTFLDFKPPLVPVVKPPVPQEQPVVVTAGKEYHASGIDVPCLGTPEQPWPWLPLHAAEANEDGSDKYAAGTCYLKPGVVCYFPTVKPPENRVLIYYAAKELDQFTPMVVARDVAEQAKWILFVVNTYPEKPEPKTLNAGDLLTADEIVEELARHNLEARIDRLRMVAHSRGILRLLHNTDEGRNLVSASPSGNVFDIGAVERVLSIDATHTRAPFPLLTARFPKRFYGLYLFTSGFDTLVPTSKRTIASQYLYALAAARVIESLPYFRAKWPHVAKLQLESTYDAAVKAIAMRMTGTTALKPIGKISSHDFQDALSHVKQGLSDANVTAKNLMLHACKLGDIQHLQHNWTIADFFHEATDDLAPATDMP